MKCGCETDYHEMHEGRIVSAVTWEEARKKFPKAYLEGIEKLFKAGIFPKPDPDVFSVALKLTSGMDLFINGDLWPRDLEWTRSRLGKSVKVSLCQLPNRGPLVVDVAVV